MPAVDLSAARWRKSSLSDATNTCVEVAFLSTAHWRKSSRSADSNTCVEVAFAGPAVGLRDSKNRTRPVLALPAGSFAELVVTLR